MPPSTTAATTSTAKKSPSKTQDKIKNIEQARLARRQEQADLKKKLASMDSVDQQTVGYKYLINRFCNEKLQDCIESSGITEPANDRIKVCIRKRPFLPKGISSKLYSTYSVREG
jgi:hypothetical protein